MPKPYAYLLIKAPVIAELLEAPSPKKDIDGLAWLRDIRKEILRKCKNNPVELGNYYRIIQKQYAKKIIKHTHFEEADISKANLITYQCVAPFKDTETKKGAPLDCINL